MDPFVNSHPDSVTPKYPLVPYYPFRLFESLHRDNPDGTLPCPVLTSPVWISFHRDPRERNTDRLVV